MSEKTILCAHCGAVCRESESYCKACSHSLKKAIASAESTIDGVEDSQLRAYLDKNAEYYIRSFQKLKARRLPFQFNVAAFLLGVVWFFYRKITSVAVIFSAALIMLTILLHGLVPVLFRSTTDKFFEARESYYEYSDYIHNELDLDYSQTTPKADALRERLKYFCQQLRMIDIGITLVPLAINLIVPLCANALYKRHIVQTIHRSSGGTSVRNAVVAAVVLLAVTLLIACLLYQIPEVYRFREALAKLDF